MPKPFERKVPFLAPKAFSSSAKGVLIHLVSKQIWNYILLAASCSKQCELHLFGLDWNFLTSSNSVCSIKMSLKRDGMGIQ